MKGTFKLEPGKTYRVKVNEMDHTNDVGGTELIHLDKPKTFKFEIIKLINDYETGLHLIGEVKSNKSILKILKGYGVTGHKPEDYKKYNEKLYKDTLEAYNNYNPKKVILSQFYILSIEEVKEK